LFPCVTGRPSLPGEVAASVLVLQALHDLSDRDAVAAVRCDLWWKAARGLLLAAIDQAWAVRLQKGLRLAIAA
jgi:Transposase domain (DUF772)